MKTKIDLKSVVEKIRGHYLAYQTAGGDDRYYLACKITRAAYGYSEENPKRLPPKVLNKIGVLERKVAMGKEPSVIEASIKGLLDDLEYLTK